MQSSSAKATISCNSCRRRKLKCDKDNTGCENCAKNQIPCIYASPAPEQVKRKRGPYRKDKSHREKELEHVVKDMASRNEELERQLHPRSSVTNNLDLLSSSKQLGTEFAPVQATGTAQGADPSVTRIDTDLTLPRFPLPSLAVASSLGDTPLSNRFWSPFSKDFVQVNQAVDESSSAVQDASPTVSGRSDMRSLHPPSTEILEYWHVYTARVEPMTRLLHPPSFDKLFMAANADLSNIPQGMEVLMFSIYFAAITCLPAPDVQLRFSENKDNLLRKFEYAIREALAKVNFMASRDFQTLQALVIYLLCLRRQDTDDLLWTLTGVAVRIAQLMDLANDSPRFKLSPLQVQLRRRLWWTICRLDSRSAEEYGLQPCLLGTISRDTFPLNVNDLDLYPEASEAPPPRTGFTDMTLPLVGYEITCMVSAINVSPVFENDDGDARLDQVVERKIKMVEDCQARLESDYLQYANASRPFDWMTITFTRLILTKCLLMIYHPLNGASTRPLTPEIRGKLFSASIDTTQYSHALKTDSRIEKWAWFFRSFVQWHALAYVLAELGHRTGTTEVDRAWKVLDDVLGEKNATNQGSDKSALWQPMHWLIRRAREVRAADLESRSHRSPPTKTFDAYGTKIHLGTTNLGHGTEFGRSSVSTPRLLTPAPTPASTFQASVGSECNSLLDFGQGPKLNATSAVFSKQPSDNPLPGTFRKDSLTDPLSYGDFDSSLFNGAVTTVSGDMAMFDLQDLPSNDQQIGSGMFEQLSSEDWMDLARSWDLEL